MANAKYKIHFTDDYGTGTLEADTLEDRNEIIANLNSDMEHPGQPTKDVGNKCSWVSSLFTMV